MLLPRQRVALALSISTAALLILSLAKQAPKPVPRAFEGTIVPRFDPGSAIGYTRVLAEEFPDRVTGSVGARRAAQYLRAEFRKLGYQVDSPTFSMWLGGERVQGENIVARLAGESPETVAVMAHYDGQLTSHQAAEDNASGVGVLLELARVLRQQARGRGLLLVATDGEEWGMIGARRLIEMLKSRRTVAAISIDYLNVGPSPALEMTCSGQFGGYAPLWLRELVVEAGRAQGAQVYQPTGPWEWIERAIELSFQDQGPLVEAGIPAVNMATLTKQLEASRARYHSFDDVFGGFDPSSFQMLGATTERAVAALDTLRLPAQGEMDDFLLSPHRYLPGPAVWLMQLLGILPVGLAAVFAALNLRQEKLDAAGWRLLAPARWALPLWLAPLALYGLTAANLLKRYELYPATPKDPFLYQSHLAVMVTLALVVAGGSAGLRRLGWRVEIAAARFGTEKALLYLWVAALSLAAFFINPYAMWLYLGAFAYAALLLVPPCSIPRRALNGTLLLAALLPFLGLLYFFGKEIFLGWRIMWYLVLQAAYGVWSPSAVALFLLAVVLWVRLFWISVVGADTRATRAA